MSGIFSIKPYVFNGGWKISETTVEDVFYRRSLRNGKEQFGIVVKDEELGKQLYNILYTIKNEEFYCYSTDREEMPYFKIVKYSYTFKKRIKWFFIEGNNLFRLWGNKRRIMYLMQSFAHEMSRKSIVLDATKFDFSKCDSICEFLACFIKTYDAEEKKRSKGLMIEYMHHVLTDGTDLKEYYRKNSDETIFYNSRKLPYSLAAFKICFEYYKYDLVPDGNMAEILMDDLETIDDELLIALTGKLEEGCTVIEKTDEYTVYNGNIKIYNEISEGFEKFLKSVAHTIKNHACLEHIESLIVDLNGKIIGYKFEIICDDEMKTISEMACNSQYDAVTKVSELLEYLEAFNSGSVLRRFYRILKGNTHEENPRSFDVEKNVVIIKGTQNNTYGLKTVKDLYEIKRESLNNLRIQVTEIFFKLLSKVINDKYGKVTYKRKYLSIPETKYLNPRVASEFANYMTGRKVDFENATGGLIEFFEKDMQSMFYSDGNTYFYDSRYAYIPTEVTYLYDYEAEEKYGIKIADKGRKELPDGSNLYIFDISQKIHKFKEKADNLRKEIEEKINISEDKHVTLLGVSELIINTKRLNNEGMHNIVGYITKPPKGRMMTIETLMAMNNKELLLVVGRLFSKSTNHYVPWIKTYVDDEFNFYIDYLSDEFKLLEAGTDNAADFTKWIMRELIEDGCNPYSFVDVNVANSYTSAKIEFELEILSNSYDAYCEEHDIFYNSQNGNCPVCERTTYIVPSNYKKLFDKVFEDQYATHYEIDSLHTLKIYKSALEEIAEVEKSVDKLIGLQFDTNSLDVCQDCFIPRKKVYDAEGKFVGIVYDAEKFDINSDDGNNVCIDLINVAKLMSKARIKALKRLRMQVDSLLSRHISFIKNPFNHVFLNTAHKRQVQILNIELIEFENYTPQKTEKWALNYICKVMQIDGITVGTYNKDWFAIGEELTYIETHLNKYCIIHKKYYFDTYACCPECIALAKQEEFIEVMKKSSFDKEKPINEGGEALIYAIKNGDVAKIFKEEEINVDFKCAVLFGIFGKKDILERINKEKQKYRFIYPKWLLLDKELNKIYGYRMERVKNAYPITNLKDKIEVEKLGFSREDVLEILITIGEGIERLHKEANIYIGDLNGRNILFDKDKNVYFLDFDGMGVDEIKPEFCTDGYIDPISKKNQNITKKDDWYSFAVQAFYYLTYTHPFNGIYYAMENGHRVILEIPDKMERRISLLGSHGMTPPTIAVLWDWMTEELKEVFLKIFEGDYRESIVPELKTQYTMLMEPIEDNKATNQIYRINPKFIAKKINVFDEDVVKIFNEDAALWKINSHSGICFSETENRPKRNLTISEGNTIYHVALSDDKKIAFLIFDNKEVMVFDIENANEMYRENLPCETTNLVIDDNAMYYVGFSGQMHVIYKRTFSLKGEVVKETISTGNQNIRYFNVEQASKFILIKQANELIDEVYCNSEKFYEITELIDEVYCNSEKFYEICYDNRASWETVKYNIKYDKVSKSWIIVNTFGFVLVILKNGEKVKLQLEDINEVNIANISYKSGHIYIPGENVLTIVNVQTQKIKKMACDKIMTLESKICDINSEGFSVITQNNFWEIRRG